MDGLMTRWTVADLERLPDFGEGTRYEIIDGELFMSRQPHWDHQRVCGNIYQELRTWSLASRSGQAAIAPGLIFDPENAVAPDVVWASNARLAALKDAAGHLTGAAELVVEVLSPGIENERRDRERKLELYANQGVEEYWIVDWPKQQVEVYRREAGTLRPVATLRAGDTLISPLLPSFACPVAHLFM